jgi:hypothetical protein
MINFNLRLGDTYWSKGYFNVSVDFERYLTMTEGPIDIFLGDAAKPLVGRLSRSANSNATPRIYGNKPLVDFFQRNFKRGGFVSVEIVSPEVIRIGGRAGADKAVTKPAVPPLGVSLATPQLRTAPTRSNPRRLLQSPPSTFTSFTGTSRDSAKACGNANRKRQRRAIWRL